MRNDSTTDPSQDTIKLFQIAENIAVGTQTKQRISENRKGIEEWIEYKPIREKEKRIENELQFIVEKLEQFQRVQISIQKAKNFVQNCKPKLTVIKSTLGASDDLYLNMSSAIVSNTMGMVVSKVNAVQENFQTRAQFDRGGAIYDLESTIKGAWEVITMLENFDMNQNLRSQYNSNKNTLRGIKQNLTRGGGSEFFSTLLRWGFYIFLFFIFAQMCS